MALFLPFSVGGVSAIWVMERIPLSLNFVMTANSIIPQESTIYNISCRIYFYCNCFSAHCHRHTTMSLSFCQVLYATGKRTARHGSGKGSKFIMARRRESIQKRKDGRWEGRYIKGRKPDRAAVWGYVYGRTYTAVKKELTARKNTLQTYRSSSSSHRGRWRLVRLCSQLRSSIIMVLCICCGV